MRVDGAVALLLHTITLRQFLFGALLALPSVLSAQVVATRVRVVDAHGVGVAGARVYALTGAFPGVAPLRSRPPSHHRTNHKGHLNLPLTPRAYWSLWAVAEHNGHVLRSKLSSGIRIGRKTVLVVEPATAGRITVRGMAPWRRRFAGRLGILLVVTGPVCARFSVRLGAHNFFRLPPLPSGDRVAMLTLDGRPVDWFRMPGGARTLEFAPPLEVKMDALAQARPGARFVLHYGRSLFGLVESLGVGPGKLWFANRPALYREYHFWLVELAPVSTGRVYDVSLVAGKPRLRRTRVRMLAQRIVLRDDDRLLANAKIWVGVRDGILPARTDANGEFLVWDRRPRVYRIEHGRGAMLAPCLLEAGRGLRYELDVARRREVVVRARMPGGRPARGQEFWLGRTWIGPTNIAGEYRLKLMPGAYSTRRGVVDSRVGSTTLLIRDVDPREEPVPRFFDVCVWRLVRFSGRVVNSRGKPLVARISVAGVFQRPDNTNRRTSLWTGATEQDGSFSFRIPNYARSVQAAFGGESPGQLERVELDASVQPLRVVIR